jgi:predicted nucleotide-binding protein
MNRAEAAAERQQEVSPQPVRNAVFVVHGRDNDAVEMVFAFLREVGLQPAAFEDARRMTGRPMPYIGEVLEAAFANAQAVLVLFTPDERVELAKRLRPRDQPIQVEHQPRPNVLIEAGVALTTHPDRTVIVEMGNVRNISDLAGRHMVRMAEDTPALRSEVLDRLK